VYGTAKVWLFQRTLRWKMQVRETGNPALLCASVKQNVKANTDNLHVSFTFPIIHLWKMIQMKVLCGLYNHGVALIY
jgi:hypothetical protein